MNKIINSLKTLINTNIEGSLFKYTYLYNELYISVYTQNDFCLFGIKIKADKVFIKPYKGEYADSGKILYIILKKYNDIIFHYLKGKRNNLYNVGEESEFINIFDKEELNYIDIKERLNFNFLDDYSYRRRNELDFNIEEKSELSIYHSDFECSICSGPKESFTNFIDYHSDIYDSNYFGEDTKKEAESLHLNTNINDYESITIGGNEKINDILSNKELVDSFDVVSLNKTCISVIMGDDVESAFKNNKIPEAKYLYTDQNTDSGYRVVINYLKNLDISLNTIKSNKVLFFGLNKNKNTFELLRLLDKCFGIGVDKVLIPNINTNDLKHIMKYKLGIFFTGREIKAQNIFKLYPLSQFESKVPYAPSVFLELVYNIHTYLGMQIIEKKEIEKKLINYLGYDYEYKEKTKEYTLGFVIHNFHLKQFLVDNFRGIPIISTLEDMGFNLKFFVYNSYDIYNSDVDEFISKYDYEVIYSKKYSDLDKFLKEDNINLYYSEILNDKRILDNGKNQFSVGDFEYGIEGFFRTIDRLLKKCERTDYFKNIKI